jgi:predicted aldo/keto reductase-like oxidoreductase
MKYRSFPKIPGIGVSALGLGAMRLPLLQDGKSIDEEKSAALVKAALDEGVNYFDTAWVYHEGKSEDFLGRALEGLGARAKVMLATKSPVWLMKEEADWERHIDAQLKRLRTDRIDFYLFHALGADSWEKAKALNGLKAFERAKAAGKIGHIGFSFHDEYPAFVKIVRDYDWEFCQLQYNYFDQDSQACTKGLELAGSLGVGVIVMEPLRGGGLARGLPERSLEAFAAFPKPRMPAEWALRWVLDRREVVTVLSGMGRIEELYENAGVASSQEAGTMTRPEKDAVEEARRALLEKTLVPCTTCRYCMPCPSGVDIPGIFSLRNNASIFSDPNGPRWQYKDLMFNKHSSAESCVKCGACEAACPQKIGIMKALEECHEYLRKRKAPTKKA